MKKTALVACLAVLAALFVYVATARAADEQTVQGKVTAEAKDDDGNVTKISIAAEGGKVMVADNEKAKELCKKVGETVKATGTIKAEGDVKTITITKYEIVKAAE